MLTMGGTKRSDAEEKATRQGRLLPGEDPGTRFEDDAEHWLAVYTELLQAKAALLAALTKRLTKMTDDAARAEVGATDARLLEEELTRFQGRIDFWKQRKSELHGGAD